MSVDQHTTKPLQLDEVPAGAMVWRVDPTASALTASARRRERRPGQQLTEAEEQVELCDNGFCTEVGRRLLLAEFVFHEWVLRRVEKVSFANERRVSRHASIELQVPAEAPVILDAHDRPHWLVPLSVMRRRTLVNLDLRDEDGRPISMLGLRFTQRLDESLLRAAAVLAAADGDRELPLELLRFIHRVVSGNWSTVKTAKDALQATREDPQLSRYFDDDLFSATLDRLWHNFTLYVTLPVSQGRHRLLRMSFDEPVDWVYQKGLLTPDHPKPGELVRYQPFGARIGWPRQLPALLGWRPTRIRFLVPSAENCASYHFEFSAPPGVRVARARLVAGRPNRPRDAAYDRMVSVDGVDGQGEVVGLHAVEVPNGSLCRAQVNLRISARGWLSILLFSCAAIVAVMWVLAWYLHHYWPAKIGQAQSLFLSLVAVTAGAATYVAQHDAKEVASRMLSWLRGAGLVVISTPVLAGVSLVLLQARVHESGSVDRWIWFFWALNGLSTAALLVVVAAWVATKIAERGSGALSPWDMTGITDVERKPPRPLLPPGLEERSDYLAVVRHMRFDMRAIGVHSSEGWHESYRWDAHKQQQAVARLGGAGGPARNLTGCRCRQVDDHQPGAPELRAGVNGGRKESRGDPPGR